MINKKLASYLQEEIERQNDHIELIASENYASKDVVLAAGSILTNKYAEGYPGKRYYGGCEAVDKIEQYAIDKLKELYKCEYANVQPHSGSQANQAVFNALLKSGDTILGMGLDSGGHLTHGCSFNFSGKYFKAHSYPVDKKTHLIDYSVVRKLALKHKPNLIICGASAYSRIIDFKKFREIADEVGAYLLADIAHISGLVITGLHPSPINYAHVVTSTTHKTLRGPRGGIILAKDAEKFQRRLNSGLFPGNQGGPLLHIIYAKAIAFDEALQPEFKKYQKQILKNIKVFENVFKNNNISLIADGTDNHLLLVDVKKNFSITGKVAQTTLESINITLNKNSVPGETESPFVTSGIRLGTPAITSRGFKEKECEEIAKIIIKALKHPNDKDILLKLKKDVAKITHKFPIY